MNLKDFKNYIIKNHKEDYDEYMKSLDNKRERERVILRSLDTKTKNLDIITRNYYYSWTWMQENSKENGKELIHSGSIFRPDYLLLNKKETTMHYDTWSADIGFGLLINYKE